MSGGDGTYSRGGLDFPHLTFTQNSKCGGRMVKVSPQVSYTPRVIMVEKNDDDSSVLLKQEGYKIKNDIEKKRRSEKEHSPLHNLCYH
jgi:hypothetical protein